jgi:hypothetical protein
MPVLYSYIFFSKIGSLKNHFHLRHDDVKELHHKHAQEKTDLLMLEKEVSRTSITARVTIVAFFP